VQCCGTGTAGTGTFCLRGTGMHFGSRLGSEFDIKWNDKRGEKVKISNMK
jgi:hypothetical protein